MFGLLQPWSCRKRLFSSLVDGLIICISLVKQRGRCLLMAQRLWMSCNLMLFTMLLWEWSLILVTLDPEGLCGVHHLVCFEQNRSVTASALFYLHGPSTWGEWVARGMSLMLSRWLIATNSQYSICLHVTTAYPVFIFVLYGIEFSSMISMIKW